MKMNKNIRSVAIVAIMCIALVPACKKSFLNQTDTFAATEEATLTKPQQVVALVNAIYDTY